MYNLYLLAAIIMVLAIIQSLFGMGILVFGTPTLLLLGLEFTNILGVLLPASIAISGVQVYVGRELSISKREMSHMAICSVTLIASLVMLIQMNFKVRLEMFIGVAMLIASAIRFSPKLQEKLRSFINAFESVYVLFMGAIHGFTNMGGSMLAVYIGSKSSDKAIVRIEIARYYLIFGIIQICVLIFLNESAAVWQGLLVAPIAVAVYFFIGHFLFKRLRASVYECSMTVFIDRKSVV